MKWLKFDQTSTDTSLVWGKEVIRFGDLDLIFKVTPVLPNSNFDKKKCVCVHTVPSKDGWNLTKLTPIHY